MENWIIALLLHKDDIKLCNKTSINYKKLKSSKSRETNFLRSNVNIFMLIQTKINAKNIIYLFFYTLSKFLIVFNKYLNRYMVLYIN